MAESNDAFKITFNQPATARYLNQVDYLVQNEVLLSALIVIIK